ncbi:25S rRNA (adenine645-N1)-methyltransferase [Basidiobolus ranarum]|uniref:Ribosomal RNA-processing protein 8 n=1 Tax=Basidiobolus ranarum TaxID=34480 RepID=A0ABR2VT24_9FUNG
MFFETGFNLKGPLVIGKPTEKNKNSKRKTPTPLSKDTSSIPESSNQATKVKPAQADTPNKKQKTTVVEKKKLPVKSKPQEQVKDTKRKPENIAKEKVKAKPDNVNKNLVKNEPKTSTEAVKQTSEKPNQDSKKPAKEEENEDEEGDDSEYDTDDWEDMKFSDEEDGELEDMNLEEMVKPFTTKKKNQKNGKKESVESDDEVDFNSVLSNFEAIKKQFASVKPEKQKNKSEQSDLASSVTDAGEKANSEKPSVALPNKKLSLKEQTKLKKLLEKKTADKDSSEPEFENQDIISSKHSSLTPLQQQMQKKLQGARFRWINEQLYTTSGSKAFELLQNEPGIFEEYHEGFRSQAESWSVNPIDIYIDFVNSLPQDKIIADLGCGEARLAASVKHKVWSFDLVAANDRITACDISNVPLEPNAVDVAIFSLSLMGTNFLEFLVESHRILKPGGQLKIAEVVSRFTDVNEFIDTVVGLGFRLEKKKMLSKMFIMFDFVKNNNITKQKVTTKKPSVEAASHLLKPCIYKKR